MSDVKRPLNQHEQNVMSMVNLFHTACDNGAVCGTISMTAKALEATEAYNIARPAKKYRDPKTGNYTVYFHIIELQRYINRACELVGFTILLNGGIKTHDNLFVEGNPGDDGKGRLSI